MADENDNVSLGAFKTAFSRFAVCPRTTDHQPL